jgi:hypothetical protein
LNLRESNEIFRRAIIKTYFEVELLKIDYHKSNVRHPLIKDEGFTVEDKLHLYFDIMTGNDYPDGDEWHFWKHKELVRFKYGKSKKLVESLDFINKKYRELSRSLYDSSIIDQITK